MTKVRPELACIFIGVWMLLLLGGCAMEEYATVRSGEALTQGEAGAGPAGSTSSLARRGKVLAPEGQVIEDMPLAIAQEFFPSGSGGAGVGVGDPGMGAGVPGVTLQIPGMVRGSHSDVRVAGIMPEGPPQPKGSRAMESGSGMKTAAGLMSGSSGDLEFFPSGSGGAGVGAGGPGVGAGVPGVTSRIPGMARGSYSDVGVAEMSPEGLPHTRGGTPEIVEIAPDVLVQPRMRGSSSGATHESSQELAMLSPSEGGGMPRSHMATSRAGLADVFFDYDQYMIRKEEVRNLEANAELLKTTYQDSTLLVAGHCDERGTVEYNIVLGERRAQAVKDYLVDLGVPASRVEVISYGKEKPFCAEHNVTCWQQNRRGHFVLR